MLDELKNITEKIKTYKVTSDADLEGFRKEFIGKKNIFNNLFEYLKNVPAEQKKVVGSSVNEVKKLAKKKFQELILELKASVGGDHSSMIDPTLPEIPFNYGSIHPLSKTRNKIIRIFERQGFNVVEGPEIEDDHHNFSALNFPVNHPARDMQDTYFIKKNPDFLLRTHTSNVQVRLMENQSPPLRSIMPGRVYRNEAISARSHCFFHQVEGLYVDKNVSFQDLKQTLYHFAMDFFGKETRIRFRPSYFPFTEPSAEIDISCFICNGAGCRICKGTSWVEIGGSGMVDPNVLENCGINPNIYSGFAFGMGIERITMLKYQIDDLRLFSENDLRFLRQFH